jgi:hypothetical protein
MKSYLKYHRVTFSILALALSACASIDEATYKAYPLADASKVSACRAKGEEVYTAQRYKDVGASTSGRARTDGANAYEKCVEG